MGLQYIKADNQIIYRQNPKIILNKIDNTPFYKSQNFKTKKNINTENEYLLFDSNDCNLWKISTNDIKIFNSSRQIFKNSNRDVPENISKIIQILKKKNKETSRKTVTFNNTDHIYSINNSSIITSEISIIFQQYMNNLQSSNDKNNYIFNIKDTISSSFETFYFAIKKSKRSENRMKIILNIPSVIHNYLEYKCQLEVNNSQKKYRFKFANPNKGIQVMNNQQIEKKGVEYFIGKEEKIYFERRERIQVLDSFYSIITYVEKEVQKPSKNKDINELPFQQNYIFENYYQESINLFFQRQNVKYQSFIQPILSLNHTLYTQGFIFAEENVENNPDKAVFIFYRKNTEKIDVLLQIIINKSTLKIIVNTEELNYNQSKNCWISNSYRFAEQGIFKINQGKIFKLSWIEDSSIFFDWRELQKNEINKLKNIINNRQNLLRDPNPKSLLQNNTLENPQDIIKKQVFYKLFIDSVQVNKYLTKDIKRIILGNDTKYKLIEYLKNNNKPLLTIYARFIKFTNQELNFFYSFDDEEIFSEPLKKKGDNEYSSNIKPDITLYFLQDKKIKKVTGGEEFFLEESNGYYWKKIEKRNNNQQQQQQQLAEANAAAEATTAAQANWVNWSQFPGELSVLNTKANTAAQANWSQFPKEHSVLNTKAKKVDEAKAAANKAKAAANEAYKKSMIILNNLKIPSSIIRKNNAETEKVVLNFLKKKISNSGSNAYIDHTVDNKKHNFKNLFNRISHQPNSGSPGFLYKIKKLIKTHLSKSSNTEKESLI